MVEESYDMDLMRKRGAMLILAALTVEALDDDFVKELANR